MNNQDNEWQTFLETGKDVPKAVKSKQIIDVHKQLKSKYPGIPIPNPNRIIRTVAPKQRRAVITQEGAR